ncbi:hypothetical protein NECID01_0006 [Nematocida sp. AWRm77]|nr:hypothetical protein NECID01_0006 [Nematocida sp. AWRm77]
MQHKEEPKEDAHAVQLDMRLGKLANLMCLFREKVDSLEKTVKSLEEKVSIYAVELSKAYKQAPPTEQ